MLPGLADKHPNAGGNKPKRDWKPITIDDPKNVPGIGHIDKLVDLCGVDYEIIQVDQSRSNLAGGSAAYSFPQW